MSVQMRAPIFGHLCAGRLGYHLVGILGMGAGFQFHNSFGLSVGLSVDLFNNGIYFPSPG